MSIFSACARPGKPSQSVLSIGGTTVKFLATILVAAAFCLSSPLAVRAEIALSIVNKTGHEIVYMRAQAGEASIGITPDIMPDTTFVFTQDSKITQLHFDSGRTFFAFDNVNIDSSVTLQLTYEDNVAVLLPEGQDPNEYFAALQEQADQTSISDKGATVTLDGDVEGFCHTKELVKEDGTQPAAGDELAFKVTDLKRSAKRVGLSHLKTYTESKSEKVSSESDSTKKAVKKINSNIEKTTLGDISELAALKSKLEKGE